MNGGVWAGESGRDAATKEMGEERHERMGADRPSLWGTLLFTEGVPLNVFGGSSIGVLPTTEKGGDRQ